MNLDNQAISKQVKQFYNEMPFPGNYTITQLLSYGHPIQNKYLNIIDQNIDNHFRVLDIGCGTGLISNLFASRYPNSLFTGVDFSHGIDYASKFSIDNQIKNTKFIKHDVTQWNTEDKFDVIICQGVLHHIPEIKIVLNLFKKLLVPNGKLIIGLYHPWGKVAKKFFKINYNSSILEKDQELNPYEISYSFNDVIKLFPDYNIIDYCPRFINSVSIPALFNFKNGGLVTYILKVKK